MNEHMARVVTNPEARKAMARAQVAVSRAEEILHLRSKPFNLSLSDRLLMEAGIRRIPRVASSIPAFVDWSVGDLIARDARD